MLLSPLANPFIPMRIECNEDSAFRAIYIDGVPELVIAGEQPDHEIIQNIPDEAIDEVFPLSATDAAELDTVDQFLMTMVNISYLEDREEKARNGFSHIKKRWESRRQQGLNGKSIQIRADIERAIHGTSLIRSTKNIVPYDRNIERSSGSNLNSKLREKVITKHQNLSKRSNVLHRYSKPIQQPRKMN